MTADLDTRFGTVRSPSKVDAWEQERTPLSKCVLSDAVGTHLSVFREANEPELFKHAAKTTTYIWVMDGDGIIHISVEELAELPDGTEIAGYPRRRDFPRHPSEEKKLGHPCLVAGDSARVGGELFLDEKSDTLCWFVNVNSGRYCRIKPPSEDQVANILTKFRELVDTELELDDIAEA